MNGTNGSLKHLTLQVCKTFLGATLAAIQFSDIEKLIKEAEA